MLFIVGPGFLGIFLLIPAIVGTLKRYQLNHLAFGASGFHFQCRLRYFYGAYLRAQLPVFILAGAVFALAMIGALTVALLGGDEPLKQAMAVPLAVFAVIFILAYLAVLLVTPAYLGALINNLIWNNTNLDEHKFVSDQTFWGITGITLSNWLLILLTAGLYWPWAKVKLAAYRANHTAVLVMGNMDHFVAGASSEKSAIGEEIADVFDFDIAL